MAKQEILKEDQDKLSQEVQEEERREESIDPSIEKDEVQEKEIPEKPSNE